MAAANYCLCYKCKAKTFYDSDVDYEDSNLGAMAALCKDCAQTHEITIAKRGDFAELRAALRELLVVVGGTDMQAGLLHMAERYYDPHHYTLSAAELAVGIARTALAATEGEEA